MKMQRTRDKDRSAIVDLDYLRHANQAIKNRDRTLAPDYGFYILRRDEFYNDFGRVIRLTQSQALDAIESALSRCIRDGDITYQADLRLLERAFGSVENAIINFEAIGYPPFPCEAHEPITFRLREPPYIFVRLRQSKESAS